MNEKYNETNIGSAHAFMFCVLSVFVLFPLVVCVTNLVRLRTNYNYFNYDIFCCQKITTFTKSLLEEFSK